MKTKEEYDTLLAAARDRLKLAEAWWNAADEARDEAREEMEMARKRIRRILAAGHTDPPPPGWSGSRRGG